MASLVLPVELVLNLEEGDQVRKGQAVVQLEFPANSEDSFSLRFV